MGLKDKISTASTTAEILHLLAEGRTYQLACSKTKRQWQRHAEHRTKVLETVVDKKPSNVKKIKKQPVSDEVK